jgi:hypothetical protein
MTMFVASNENVPREYDPQARTPTATTPANRTAPQCFLWSFIYLLLVVTTIICLTVCNYVQDNCQFLALGGGRMTDPGNLTSSSIQIG